MNWFKDMFSPRQQADDDAVVTSELTIGQLLDYVSGTGDLDALGNYAIGARDIRNAALAFPTYLRAITLLSGVIAQLITNGSLRIVDSEGEIVETDSAKRALNLLEHSPDGRMDAHTWLEDFVIDYLVEGNALCEVVRGSRNRVVGLSRLSVWDANTVQAQDGTLVYRARPVGMSMTNQFYEISELNVIHPRWPRTLRYSASSTANRWNFAPAPVRLMRPALEVGLAGDQFIRDWYRAGQNNTIGISLKEDVTATQAQDVQAAVAQASQSRRPLIVGGDAKFTNLQNNASNKDQADLREFQVSDVSRVYGIPGPIMNQQVTQWGQGIEQLKKLFWSTCIKQHIDRVLAPIGFHLLQPRQRFVVDPTDLLRGDITSIASLITATRRDAQTDQIATVDEQRHWLGLPRTPEHGELEKATGMGEGMGMGDDGGETEEF